MIQVLELIDNTFCVSNIHDYRANTKRWHNASLMLVHRLRRWPNIKLTLYQRLVFAGSKCSSHAFSDHIKQWLNDGPMTIYVGPTCKQHVVFSLNTKRWTDVFSMVAHRLRRWPNNKTTLVQLLLLTELLGILYIESRIYSSMPCSLLRRIRSPPPPRRTPGTMQAAKHLL